MSRTLRVDMRSGRTGEQPPKPVATLPKSSSNNSHKDNLQNAVATVQKAAYLSRNVEDIEGGHEVREDRGQLWGVPLAHHLLHAAQGPAAAPRHPWVLHHPTQCDALLGVLHKAKLLTVKMMLMLMVATRVKVMRSMRCEASRQLQDTYK